MSLMIIYEKMGCKRITSFKLYKLVIFLIIIFSIPLYADTSVNIEGTSVKINKMIRFPNGTLGIRINNNIIIKTASNIYSVFKKDPQYLFQIYKIIKSEKYFNSNRFTYNLFMATEESYDIILNIKYDSIIHFTSNSGSVINGYSIPEKVEVTIEPDSLAYLLNNQREVKSISINKLILNREILFNNYNFITPNFDKSIIITKMGIQGIINQKYIEAYGAKWTNSQLEKNYGISFNTNWDVLSACLFSGSIYGFKEKATYIFSKFFNYDGVAKLEKIIHKGNVIYSSEKNGGYIYKNIMWNNILLNEGDILQIQKGKDVKPTDEMKIMYKLLCKSVKKISAYNKTYFINKENVFYGNYLPESLLLAKDATLRINNKDVKVTKDTVINFYSNGNFKSGIFLGILSYDYQGSAIEFYNDISFYQNSRLKEGVLAKTILLDIWGKTVKIPKDSTLHFTKNGNLETYTFYDNENNLKIIFVPVFQNKP